MQNRREPVICGISIVRWRELEGADGFVRTNRWYMVNPSYVVSAQQREGAKNQILHMINDVEIPISKKYEPLIQSKYQEWKDRYR